MKNLYSTKLISRSTTFIIPLGILFILFGITSIILSSIDIYYSYSSLSFPITISTFTNTTDNIINSTEIINSTYTTNTIIKTIFIPNAFSEQSIWPTLGKGIWCGLFFLVVGIFSLIAHQEKTLISIRILSLLSFISLFISFFLFLSSIIVIQRYIVEGRLNANQRTSNEQKEVVLNALLLVSGVLSFIVSLILSIGTLISGNFCQRQSDDFEDIDNFNQQPQHPPPAYSAPSYYG
ncbi:unnamed protein product [Rotaria sp. Silwood2]|nr:unnamed protein product [Rotaria sp. Silwood2]CAF2531057.1 unnamed protein product [Rotaria sp. Silwood2]CAF2766678.1 unnamed protein product [Rotaria sp. Silwood2]CAF2935425.1 unnamed protein product [Rotaria sp. Silwood2]CAF4388872.1 unnamed protein product [Rotaria sp. Silwood2]